MKPTMTKTQNIENVRMCRRGTKAIYFDRVTGKEIKNFVHPEHTFIPEEYFPRKTDLYYVTERHNPQLGVYYIANGRMSKTDANAKTNTVYGRNYIHSYATEKEYKTAIINLQLEGSRVQNVPHLPEVGKDYTLTVKNNAYWSSMNGTTVRVLAFPYTENGYENIPGAVLVAPIGGGLEFIVDLGSIKKV